MKLTTLLLIISLFKVEANTYSQVTKISVKLENVSLENAFKKIESISEFRFVYESNLVDLDRLVTLNFKNKKIANILSYLLADSEINYELYDRLILLTKKAVNNVEPTKDIVQYQITGTITDTGGVPLPGATILEKGTNNGTQSDFDGNFTLEVLNNDATLVISYVGFATQEVLIKGQSKISVQLLEDTTGLDEVVVVGYGTQRKKELSTAVSQVDGDDLTQAPISTLTNALTGRVPGLVINQTSAEPGRESNQILIRGNATFGDNAALIVIDGVADADGLARLNPNEIESVSVLKDASAAIYGARSANGVILVTTKRGKTGKPQFTLSSNLGFSTPIGVPDFADGLQYASYLNRLNWRNSDWDPNYAREFSDAEIDDIRSGAMKQYDWADVAYKDFATITDNSLSVRGGSENVKYFVSTRYLQQESAYRNDDIGENKQYNLRSNIDIKASDRLDFGIDLSMRQQDVRQNWYGFSGAIQTAGLTEPFFPFYINDDPRYPAGGRLGQSTIATLKGGSFNDNERRNLSARIKFNYKIPGVEGLSIGGFGSAVVVTDLAKSWVQPWEWYQENSDPTGEPVKVTQGFLRLDQRNDRNKLYTVNFSTNYSRTIAEHHNIDLLAQAEHITGRTDWFSAGNDDYLSAASPFLSSGGPSRSASYAAGQASEAARIGYSGRARYNFKSKYFAEFVFRYEGSQNFAEDQRFGFFPGVSGAWLVSEEDFLKNSNVISSLKLKASWAELGNDRISAFNYLATFGSGNSTVVNGTTLPGIRESGSVNPDVTWEVTATTNFGVEASFFNNKLFVEAAVFKMNTRDILAQPNLTLPNFTGIDPPNLNIGTMENKGYELELNYRSKIGELEFSIGGNMAYSKNKITNFDEPPFDEEYQNLTGRPFGSTLRYHAIGIFRTQADLDNNPTRSGDRLGSIMVEDTNNDGEITGADRQRIRSVQNPNFFYGITSQLNYKNFDMNMLWQGATGGYKPYRTIFSRGNNGFASYANNTWSPDNIDAPWPAPTEGIGGDTDFFLFRTNYLRLKTLELGYTLPETAIKSIGIDNLRVYVSGYNLITIDKNADLGFSDPESTNDLTWDFPNTQTFNFGLNVTF